MKLEQKIANLKNMSKEELVNEYCKMVMFTAQNAEAMFGVAGEYEEAIKAEMLRRMK